MLERKLSKDGSIHVTDEIYNTAISSVGTLLAALGSALLIFQSLVAQKPWHLLAFSIYSFGLVNLFLLSALHHGINSTERVENILRRLDYFIIFIMIAGAMTPFCLILLRTTYGFSILGFMWILALGGIAIQLKFPHLPKWFTTGQYIGLGWLGCIVVYNVWDLLPWEALFLLVLGGLIYTVGAVIYVVEKPNPFPGKFGFHEIWHLFVLAGTACHFSILYFYLLPHP